MTNSDTNPRAPERMAPDDGIWVCAACGKTATETGNESEGIR